MILEFLSRHIALHGSLSDWVLTKVRIDCCLQRIPNFTSFKRVWTLDGTTIIPQKPEANTKEEGKFFWSKCLQLRPREITLNIQTGNHFEHGIVSMPGLLKKWVDKHKSQESHLLQQLVSRIRLWPRFHLAKRCYFHDLTPFESISNRKQNLQNTYWL